MLVSVLKGFIQMYRLCISSWFGPSCRYHPTCSVYMQEALERHGAPKGLVLGFLRICTCHPYSKKNWKDPVPDAFAWRDIFGYKRACSQKNKVCSDDE